MKIHLVWITPEGDHIIDRLARILAERNDWTLSGSPDQSADLNYFMLYIDYVQRFNDWNRTPIAAYFSHLEPHQPHKKLWWDQAAKLVKNKLVTADQYGAILPPKVYKVTVPVDPVFTIRDKPIQKKPLVGVSGFVAPGGRKGEALAGKLAKDLRNVEVVCSGQGWPVRRVNDSLGGLPAFYNSLSVYLCTSSIEGVPMPPLEALACGIPVVIPYGVGMLDELPNIPGIYRYPAGDYTQMKIWTEIALSVHHDREALRDAIKGYTPEAWASTHRTAFEDILGVEPAPAPVFHAPAPAKSKRGVYYVAFGGPARDCARAAMHSFRQFLPDIPIALCSNEPLGVEDVFIQQPDEDIGGRSAKVRIYDLAPAEWESIAYLDADTEIIAPERLLWEVLEDGWDMAICKNPARFHVASQMKRPDNKEECEETYRQIGSDQVIQLNGGVFAFRRNERTKAFFHAWVDEWRRWGGRDQAALLRALWKNPLKLYALGNEWNLVTRYEPPEKAAWLLHYPMTARRWTGVIRHPLSSPEAWAAVAEFERAHK